MKIKFIGTGSGKTSLKRFHSSFIISNSTHKLLVDAGDSISRALLSANENYASITSILISHFHPDHVAGLPLLLVQMKMVHRTEPLIIFVHKEEKKFMERFILNSYLFEERLGFNLHFVGYDFEEEIQIENGFSFLARENSHFADYCKLAQKHSLPNVSSSFLFRKENFSLHYTADVGGAQDLLLFDDTNNDYLITEATHITLVEILEYQKQKKLKSIFLTHLPEELEAEMDENELESFSIFGASDGSEFELY